MYNYLLDGNAPFVYANYGSGIYENPIKKPIKTATRYVIDEAFGESNLKKTFYNSTMEHKCRRSIPGSQG